jgi:AbrB family looped-hinge helix DNA binding protein
MKTTIDTAGRVVIPKRLRERLGLVGAQRIEIVEREGRLEITAAATPMSLEAGPGGPVAVPDEELPTLTDDVVRATQDGTRR